MAFKKTNKRFTKFKVDDYVPVWNQQHSNATNLMTQALFSRLGITDLSSYFVRLAIPIVICALAGAVYGAITAGLAGFVWGLLAGLAAPGLLLWLAVIVGYCAVILGAFFAAWTLIFYGAIWLLGR